MGGHVVEELLGDLHEAVLAGAAGWDGVCACLSADMPELRRLYLHVCSVLAGSMCTLTGGWPSQLRMSGWRE